MGVDFKSVFMSGQEVFFRKSEWAKLGYGREIASCHIHLLDEGLVNLVHGSGQVHHELVGSRI